MVGETKRKKKSTSVVKTLRGADAWNKGAAPKRKKGKRLSGNGKSTLNAVLGAVVENLKPVAGGVGAEMIVNSATKTPQATAGANAVAFIAGSAIMAMAPQKAKLLKEVAAGMAICAGKDFASAILKNLGVTSLSGYTELAGSDFRSLSGYTELAGSDFRSLSGYTELAGKDMDLVPGNVSTPGNDYIIINDEYGIEEIDELM